MTPRRCNASADATRLRPVGGGSAIRYTTRTTPPQHTARAFTLIELLVVISIIMLLAAMALPVLMQTTRQARAVQCVTNLKELAAAFRSYSTTYGGYLTGTEACYTPSWAFHCDPDRTPSPIRPAGWEICPTGGQLYPFYRDPELVLCPSDRVGNGNGKLSYAVPVIIRYRIMDNVPNSSATLLIIEEHPKYNIGGHANPARREGGFACSDRPSTRHMGKTSHAWFDGHADLVEYPEGTNARDFNMYIWNEIGSDAWRYNCGQDYKPPHLR